ncbi:MAG: hypothetical protein ACK559_11975, partial [bacterium]
CATTGRGRSRSSRPRRSAACRRRFEPIPVEGVGPVDPRVQAPHALGEFLAGIDAPVTLRGVQRHHRLGVEVVEHRHEDRLGRGRHLRRAELERAVVRHDAVLQHHERLLRQAVAGLAPDLRGHRAQEDRALHRVADEVPLH